jgi:hypothetical protein
MTVKVQIDASEFLQALEEHLDEKCKEICGQIKADAKRTVAFKDITGNLRKSIKVKKSKFDDGGYLVKAGGRGAMQAWLVEHGHEIVFGTGPNRIATGKMVPPHPFLKPALDKNIEYARQKLSEKMSEPGYTKPPPVFGLGE